MSVSPRDLDWTSKAKNDFEYEIEKINNRCKQLGNAISKDFHDFDEKIKITKSDFEKLEKEKEELKKEIDKIRENLTKRIEKIEYGLAIRIVICISFFQFLNILPFILQYFNYDKETLGMGVSLSVINSILIIGLVPLFRKIEEAINFSKKQ